MANKVVPSLRCSTRRHRCIHELHRWPAIRDQSATGVSPAYSYGLTNGAATSSSARTAALRSNNSDQSARPNTIQRSSTPCPSSQGNDRGSTHSDDRGLVVSVGAADEQLHLLVDEMDDEQVERALLVVEPILHSRSTDVGAERRPLPAFVGSFESGRHDLSQRVDELLADGFGR